MLRPRALVHRGHIEASGLVFDASWLDETDTRARVIAHAKDGATVLALGDTILVRFASPRRIDADRSEAALLVAHGASLLAVPLDRRERTLLDLDRLPPALVRARGGCVVIDPLANAQVVDLAQWLAVDDWTVVPVASLGLERVVARAVIVQGAEDRPDVRTILGDKVPTPAPQRAALLSALARTPPQRGYAEGGGAGWLGGIGRWLSDVLSWGDQPALPSSAPPVRPTAPPPPPRAPSPPGWLSRVWMKLVMGSPLARAIGRRQAEYLGKTLRLFEDGDFENALRHAIPLSSMPGAAEQTSLSVPTPRIDLKLTMARGTGGGSSIHVGEEFLAHMRTIYRNAARELELAGRLEEAAFVLFELLGNDDAGVAMLERHTRFELAAQMAESRGLAPGMVIRLWFLAGKPGDAIRVARRTGAYADAVARLERGHTEHAQRLRLLWGERLAAAGDYAAAFDAAWPVERARALARRWLDLAIEFGGPTGARMLAKKVALAVPDDATRDAVQTIVDDASDDGRALRGILGDQWPAAAAEDPVRTLGRTLCRRLMLDAHATGDGAIAGRLRDRLGDRLLELEGTTPTLPKVTTPTLRGEVFEAHERGLQSIYDAIALPGGRHLLALGESGIVLVDRHGRRLRHYEHPATRLLVADTGSRVVTMIRRGPPEDSPAVLGRIDLVSGRAAHWCDARFLDCADGHDGAEWYMTEHDAVASVDVQAPGLAVIWRVSRLPGRVVAIARSRDKLSFATEHPDGGPVEVWTYVLGGERRLDRRHPLELPRGATVRRATLDASGAIVIELLHEHEPGLRRLLAWHPGGRVVEARMPEGVRMTELCAGATGAIASLANADGCTIEPLAYDTLSPRKASLVLRGAQRAGIRVGEASTIVFDDRGRLVTLAPDGRIIAWQLVL
jgi:hypothetical protein